MTAQTTRRDIDPGPQARVSLLGAQPRTSRLRGRLPARQPARALGLVIAGWVLLGFMFLWPQDVSWSLYGPLVVVAGLFLTPGWFVLVSLSYAACLGMSAFMVRGWSLLQGCTLLALVLTMTLMVIRTRSRERLGVSGNSGEDMLVDLRDRLLALGEMPSLPSGWHAESAIRSAYGDKFSGDLAVTSLSPDGQRLEVALVDLSGKGRTAGTRSLLCSGAIGGLLGQLEPDRLLPAANHYLVRQQWSEGFATAVHLAVDLRTGQFTLGNAGHPAPIQFSAGSGLWTILESAGGPVLGILPEIEFPRSSGRLGRGDALVLYTDGVIEAREHDLGRGLDRLLGNAERLITTGFGGGARRLCADARAGESDDRAVVVIWRD
jgi:hypothetical protein